MTGTPEQFVIVGAGPSGMVLAYLLASNGAQVRVIERHPDFEREFRGDYLQPSVFRALQALDVLPTLEEQGTALTGVERRMFVGHQRQVQVPGGGEKGALVSQPAFLRLLHQACSRFPNYRLDFETSATELIEEGGRTIALRAKRKGQEERIDGDVFVVCTGRNTPLRAHSGIEVTSYSAPAHTLWLRFDFSDARELLPKGELNVHMFGQGVVTVYFQAAGDRLQVAYSAAGDLSALRKDLPALKAALLPTLPSRLRSHVERKLDQDTESQILRVVVDRLQRWSKPGLLFLGDAAHTMSPSGGAGLNIAIRDSIVAANHFLTAQRAGTRIDLPLLERIEAERRPEVEAMQAGQVRAHGMVFKPLPVLHLMFTVLPVFLPMINRKLAKAQPLQDPVEIQYPVRITQPPAGNP